MNEFKLSREIGENKIKEIPEFKEGKDFSEHDYKNILKSQISLIETRPLESLSEENRRLIREFREQREEKLAKELESLFKEPPLIEKESPLNEDEKKRIKEAHPDWPDSLIDAIGSWKEYEIYDEAGLVYAKINGRDCLIRSDLDLDYVDPKTGKTNRQLMAEGKAPIDPKTGQKIELHHIGKKFDGPLAELTESEHRDNYKTLHPADTGPSWRQDETKNNEYNNVQRPEHWKERAKKQEA